MKIITLDASQIVQYLKCPLSWKLQYVDLLSIVGASEKALNMGTVMHDLLDRFYRIRSSGEDFKLAAETAARDFTANLADNKEEWRKIPALKEEDITFVVERFMMYVFHYAATGRDFKVMSAPNGDAGVELGFSKEFRSGKTASGKKFVFIIEGRIDLLAKLEVYGDELCVVDHKTQSRFNNLYEYSVQFLTYAWAARARYAIINYIGFQAEKDVNKWFRRQPVKITPFMMHRWEKQVERVFYRILSGDLSENLVSCAGAFGSNPCQYTKLCETESPDMKNSIIKSNYLVGESKWRPW
jgi:hypothetical protein